MYSGRIRLGRALHGQIRGMSEKRRDQSIRHERCEPRKIDTWLSLVVLHLPNLTLGKAGNAGKVKAGRGKEKIMERKWLQSGYLRLLCLGTGGGGGGGGGPHHPLFLNKKRAEKK